MSFKMKGKAQDYSKYDSMGAEELSKILHDDLDNPPETQLAPDELLYVFDLFCMKSEEFSTFSKTTEASWAEFITHYMPQEHGVVSKQLVEEEEDLRETLELLDHLNNRKPRKKHCRITARKLAAIAATVAVVCMSTTLPVNATGDTIFDTIVIWAKETFQFIPKDSNVDAFVENTEFQEYLHQNNVSVSVPTLIPVGYELSRVNNTAITPQQKFFAEYSNSQNSYFKISIRIRITGYPSYIEQLGDDYTSLKIAGQECFVMKSIDHMMAVWITDSHECLISGDLSFSQIETMLNSLIKE